MVVLLVVCALGLGTLLHLAQAGEMPQRAMEAAAEQPVPSVCEVCGDRDVAASHSGCVISCIEERAEARIYGPTFGSSNVVWAPSKQWPDGSASSPEPHPPKLVVPA